MVSLTSLPSPRRLLTPVAAALALALPMGAALAQPTVPQQTSPRLSETQRQELFQRRRAIEQKSHAGRIAILQDADRCISAAQNREAFRACEQKEQQARRQLRSQLRAEAEQIRAQFGLPQRPEGGRKQRQGAGGTTL